MTIFHAVDMYSDTTPDHKIWWVEARIDDPDGFPLIHCTYSDRKEAVRVAQSLNDAVNNKHWQMISKQIDKLA